MFFNSIEDPTPFTSHRPWPLPRGRWIMGQRWSNLLFAHWPLPVDRVRPLVPSSLTLDTFNQTAWITVAPFLISHLHARWLPPLPMISEFPELNVRTYVTYAGKPGVYFFSLDAGSALAVEGARRLYRLPYYRASMKVHDSSEGRVFYQSHRIHAGAPPADFDASYRPTGSSTTSTPGSLDYFLTERYCLYAADSAGGIYRAEIHHQPWPLQPAECQIGNNTMAAAAGLTVDGPPARVSFSRALDVAVWPLVRAS